MDPDKIIEVFYAYMEYGGHQATRKQFQKNLANKLEDESFVTDIDLLLATEYEWDVDEMATLVTKNLVDQLAD